MVANLSQQLRRLDEKKTLEKLPARLQEFIKREMSAQYFVNYLHPYPNFLWQRQYQRCHSLQAVIQLRVFVGRNRDLMELQDEWPSTRPEMGEGDTRRRWHHSDTKDVAFRYNHRLFEDWIAQGQLKGDTNENN
ncbi:hypothetical protein [Prosthecobacter fusiformis]|nr:hypothetical protein [Prosthecobacter fusiformis]